MTLNDLEPPKIAGFSEFFAISGADLRFLRPSARRQFLHCETTDTGPVCRAVCLFTSQRWSRYQIILLGDRGTCVWTTCLRSLLGSVLVRSRACASELPQDYKSDTLPLDYRGVKKLAILSHWVAVSQKRCEIGSRLGLLLITNRKFHTFFHWHQDQRPRMTLNTHPK